MASELDLAGLVQTGHDIASFKLYSIGLTALWFYDYFLTLADELRYAWNAQSTLIFVLFLLNRYIPPVFLVWAIISSWSFNYTSEMCAKTAFIELMYFTFITLFSQIVLTQRTYAITEKSKWVAGFLYTIVIAELGVGLYMFIYAAAHPVESPTIPLDSFRLCFVPIASYLTILQISLSLGFDVAIFVLVIAQTQNIRSRSPGMHVSSILNTVSRDAEIYFAVIASSHLMAVVMYSAARPSLRGIGTLGNSVYIPVMISRMIISLKKAAGSPPSHTSREAPSGFPGTTQDSHTPFQAESIQLSVIRGE